MIGTLILSMTCSSSLAYVCFHVFSSSKYLKGVNVKEYLVYFVIILYQRHWLCLG